MGGFNAATTENNMRIPMIYFIYFQKVLDDLVFQFQGCLRKDGAALLHPGWSMSVGRQRNVSVNVNQNHERRIF